MKSKNEGFNVHSPRKIALLVLACVLGIVLLLVILEGLGLFPGSFFNRLAVEHYLEDRYQMEDCTIVEGTFDKENKVYSFQCQWEGKTFPMTASRLQVRQDGYHHQYLCNQELSKAVNESLTTTFLAKLEATELPILDATVYLEYDFLRTQYPVCDEATVQKAIDAHLSQGKLTIWLLGEKTDFEAYKDLIVKTLPVVREMTPKIGETCQFFYYYGAPEFGLSERLPTMQFESQVPPYLYDSADSQVRNSSGVHYIVELTPEQAKKLKYYGIAQTIYVVCVAGTVIGLSILWIVRRRRRVKKQKTKENEIL